MKVGHERRTTFGEGEVEISEQIDKVIEFLMNERKDLSKFRSLTLFYATDGETDDKKAINVIAMGAIQNIVNDVPDGMIKLGEQVGQAMKEMHTANAEHIATCPECQERLAEIKDKLPEELRPVLDAAVSKSTLLRQAAEEKGLEVTNISLPSEGTIVIDQASRRVN